MPKNASKSASMDAGLLELLRITIGMQNGTATLENSLVLSYKVKHACAMWPSKLILGVYSRKMKT